MLQHSMVLSTTRQHEFLKQKEFKKIDHQGRVKLKWDKDKQKLYIICSRRIWTTLNALNNVSRLKKGIHTKSGIQVFAVC